MSQINHPQVGAQVSTVTPSAPEIHHVEKYVTLDPAGAIVSTGFEIDGRASTPDEVHALLTRIKTHGIRVTGHETKTTTK
jgi:hypothetical protein